MDAVFHMHHFAHAQQGQAQMGQWSEIAAGAQLDDPRLARRVGEHDLGCAPFHGRKFVARLRALNAGNAPSHLRVHKNQGHGPTGLGDAAEYAAEWLGFVMAYMGMSLPATDYRESE